MFRLFRHRRTAYIVGAGSLLIGLVALGGLVLQHRPTPSQSAKPATTSVANTFTAGGETVSTAPITVATYTSKAGPAEPKQINLPTIGASGFVEAEGTTTDGRIAVPKNINLAGWFSGAGRPGEPGLSIIEGHVDGPGQAGLFYKLKDLRANDQFSVQRGDGTVLQYQVRSVHSYKEADSLSYLFSQDPGISSQLNLITCGGTFDRQTRNYDQRVVVTTALKP